jgi:hypothetical protein
MAQQLGAIRYRGKIANVVGFKNTASRKTNNNFVRERATTVSNPKSYAQATQRCKAKPAQAFYNAFIEVLNHAFLPSDKESRNRNEFLSLAMKNPELPDVPRGVTRIPLNALQISKGSLGLDFMTEGTDATSSIIFGNLQTSLVGSLSAASISGLSTDLLTYNPQLVEGQELTFLAVLINESDTNDRLACILTFVLDKSDTITLIGDLSNLLSLQATNGGIELRVGSDLSGYSVGSAGLIISSKTNSSWRYTSSFMQRTSKGEAAYTGLAKVDVIESYMGTRSTQTSDLILQQADNAPSQEVHVVKVDNYSIMLKPSVTGTLSTSTGALAKMSNGGRKVVSDNFGNIYNVSGQNATVVTITTDGDTRNLTMADTTWAGNPIVKVDELGLILR